MFCIYYPDVTSTLRFSDPICFCFCACGKGTRWDKRRKIRIWDKHTRLGLSLSALCAFLSYIAPAEFGSAAHSCFMGTVEDCIFASNGSLINLIGLCVHAHRRVFFRSGF